MTLWVTLCTSQQPVKATTIAMTGEISEGSRILPTTPSSLVPSPVHLTPAQPRPAAPAPVRPPSRACDELDGRPSSQVNRFHRMPPASPARMMSSTASPPSASSSGFGAPSLVCRLIDGVGDGERHLHREEGADEVEDGRQAHGDLGLQGPGRDRRSHRVGGVVEAVREVEGQCRHDDEHEGDVCCVHESRVCGRHLHFTNASGRCSPAVHLRRASGRVGPALARCAR